VWLVPQLRGPKPLDLNASERFNALSNIALVCKDLSSLVDGMGSSIRRLGMIVRGIEAKA
jgi:hypothetical protein